MPSRRLPVAPPRGFTLIELVVVMLIAAIVVAFALPDMRRMVNENRMASEANAMLAVLTYARGEALRRNRSVGVCMTGDGASCLTTAPATGYAAGIMVFEINPNPTGTNLPLQVTIPVANGARILGDATVSPSLVFGPAGDVPQLSGQAFLAVVPVAGAAANSCQRLLQVMPIGRTRVIPARYTGGTLTSAASYTLTQDCGVVG